MSRNGQVTLTILLVLLCLWTMVFMCARPKAYRAAQILKAKLKGRN